MRRVTLNAMLVSTMTVLLSAAASTACGQRCGAVCPPRPACGGGIATVIGAGGSYGNAGFGAGYSIQIGRTLSAVSWCNQGFGAGPRWCPPSRRWGWNACAPCGPGGGYGGWSFGWPGCGVGGWYGGGAFLGAESVFVAGGGTMFSGSLRPWALPFWYGGYPANWWPGYAVTPFGTYFTPYGTLLPPGVGPRFGPVGIFPLPGFAQAANPSGPGAGIQAAMPRSSASSQVAAASRARRARAVRSSTESGRRRAATHLSDGDRHLREAAGDRARLREALASYRQAAAAERDVPDTYIRLAIAQAALGDRAGVDASLARAVALDGRLAGAGGAADPIFGGVRETSPLAARGHAIIMEIAAADLADGPPLAWLADSWSVNWTDALGGLAAAGP